MAKSKRTGGWMSCRLILTRGVEKFCENTNQPGELTYFVIMRRQFAATAVDVFGLAGRLDEIGVARPPFSLTFENALAPARFRGASEREIWKNPACAKMPRRRHLPPFERRSRDVHRFSLAEVYSPKTP